MSFKWTAVTETRLAERPPHFEHPRPAESFRRIPRTSSFAELPGGDDHAGSLAGLLDLFDVPAAVLGAHHHVIAMNHLLAPLVPSVFRDGPSGIRLSDAASDGLLQRTLVAIEQGFGARGHAIPIPATQDRSAILLRVSPVAGQAGALMPEARAVVHFVQVDRPELPSPAIIQELFGLTPAEAKVARGIGNGLTIDEIAASQGTSCGTVRTQLKSVFLKVGVSRQADLVGLLAQLCGR